jgi:transcriptional regulator GlxA family with amidase domain
VDLTVHAFPVGLARRLESCRRDLLDPAQATRPIAAIAARWGFRSAIHFGRLFRATYDVPPHEYRLSHNGSRPRYP